MLKISNSQWVNTVSLVRMVINLYSFWVKIRKAFYSWIPWPATAAHFQNKHGWNEEFLHQVRLCALFQPAPLTSKAAVLRSFYSWNSNFLLLRQKGRKARGGSLVTNPVACTFSVWRKTEGFHSGPLLVFFLKGCCLTRKAFIRTHHDYFLPPF